MLPCLALLVFARGVTVSALQPSTSLDGYGRQAWSHENGLPQNTVQAISQTRDGFLWLGTEAGLVRFDGVEFQSYDRRSAPALPGNDIRYLLETRDGSLWIGSGSGLTRWNQGVVTSFTEKEGVPPGAVRGVFQTDDNSIWAWTDLGLERLENGHFVPIAGMGAERISAVFADAHGSLWVQSPHQTAVYRSGNWTIRASDARSGPFEFIATLRGNFTAFATSREVEVVQDAADRGASSVLARLSVGAELPGGRIQVIFADREGALWIGSNQGLVRWAEGKVERFPLTDPLASASILALMEDREGDLWVGTETGGLQVLRDHRFRTLDTRQGLPSGRTTTVVADSGGRIWIGTASDGVVGISEGPTKQASAPVTVTIDKGLPSNVILSMAAGRAGDVWVGTPDGLSVIRGAHVSSFTSADGLPDDFVRSLLVDADGSLWIGTRRGLALWKNASGELSNSRPKLQMELYTQANGLGSDLVGAMARDAHGDLWIATLGGLSRLRGTTVANYTTANGLTSNIVTALLPMPDGTLLIGTQDHGLTLWDGRRFVRTSDTVLGERSIHAILDDQLGHIWFATDEGIARCDWTVQPATSRPDCSHWAEFDTSDGLVSRDTSTNSHPSAWRSDDGRLWFATPRGVVEVDPAHFAINRVPPGVTVERLQIDDVLQPLTPANGPLTIQPGHVRFQFDYAGLSFVAPQKVRYRYMLDGFDHGWTEAGARRSAYYTNIPPGHYTFRVQAANNDGLWNMDGAALSFELKPHYYQTRWFLLLALTLAAAFVLFAIRVRLRRAERGFQAVLAERTRIAREIHDTLAQGYVGVSVQLEVLAHLLQQHKQTDASAQLDKVREYVRTGLAEARQSIWALRTQDRDENTLPVKLRRLVDAAKGDGLETQFALFGAYRALPAETEQEVVRIVQEAIQNVSKHSGAGLLDLRLEYGEQNVVVAIGDNGRGGASEQTGRFGLIGMRERAASVGGTLEIDSVAGTGTRIRLRIPTRRSGRDRQKETQ